MGILVKQKNKYLKYKKSRCFMFSYKKNNNLRMAIVLICLLLVNGCAHSLDITHDNQYGVRYDIKNNNNGSFLLIKLDPKNEDVISALRLWISVDEDYNENLDIIKQLQKNTNTNLALLDDEFSTYFYQEVKNPFYVINLNLYMDDTLHNVISEEAKDLIEYIGLTEEFKDNILYYENELKVSQSFKYKWIIENGEYINNISLMQSEEYTYNKK